MGKPHNFLLDKLAALQKTVNRLGAKLHFVAAETTLIKEKVVSQSEQRTSNAYESRSESEELQRPIVQRDFEPDQRRGQQRQPQQPSQSGFQEFRNRIRRNIRKPSFWINFLTLVTLFTYTCETHRANEYSREAATMSSDAIHLDQRAWVSLVYPIQLIDAQKIEASVPFKFKIRFKNSGKTPALRISYDPIIVVQNVRLTYPNYDDHKSSKNGMEAAGIHEAALLGPGEEAFITFPGQPENGQKMAFDGPSVDALNDMRQVLFIVGLVTYHDIFSGSPEHHTKFCLFYSPKSGEVGACPFNRSMD